MSYIGTKEFMIEVAKGNVAGHSIQRIIARNTDVDTSEEDIWFQGGDLSYLTTARKMNVVSASSNDSAAGTGARTIFIKGLDANYDEISETITMNGVTIVPTVNSYLRVHVCEVTTAGSGAKPAGTITLTAQTAGTVQANLPAGENRTGKSHFTIPAGKTGYLLDFLPSIAVGKVGSDVTLKARPLNEVFRMYSRLAVQSDGTSAINHQLLLGTPVFAEKTDVKVSAKGAANDQDVFCEYILLLVDN